MRALTWLCTSLTDPGLTTTLTRRGWRCWLPAPMASGGGRRGVAGAAVLLLLGLVWLALVLWQWREYRNERRMADEALRRQAESIKIALVSGIRSHRRMGFFFDELLQGALDELVASKDVVAAAVATLGGSAPKGQLLLTAGNQALLAAGGNSPGTFRFSQPFYLDAEAPPGPADRGGRGGGWGRGGRWTDEVPEQGRFAAATPYEMILVLDRLATDAALARGLKLRIWVVVAGGGVLVSVALAWLLMFRALEARNQARVLEVEARRLGELGQAAAGLAHEIRNPLGLVRGWAQRLSQSASGGEEHPIHAAAIVEECDRITARINQFLSFARPVAPRLESFSAAEVVDELAMLVEPDLEARQLRLERSDCRSMPRVTADREMLRQAVFNLLNNAIQFSPPGQTVEIGAVRGEDGTCRLEVADRGPGVPSEQQTRLFTPYFTTRAQGTGLGLAIVGRIAAAHGWQTGYRPRPEGGSVFWIGGIDG